jgi:hypothetical protein
VGQLSAILVVNERQIRHSLLICSNLRFPGASGLQQVSYLLLTPAEVLVDIVDMLVLLGGGAGAKFRTPCLDFREQHL